MKLLQLETHAFRGAPDGVWPMYDRATGIPFPLTVLAGGPASGKTSLLLAIAFIRQSVGKLGSPLDYETVVRTGEVQGRVAATWLLDEDERRVAGVSNPVQQTEIGLGRLALPPPCDGLRRLFRSYARGSRLGKLELFPSGRSLGLHGPPRGTAPLRTEALEAAMRSSRRSDKYFDLPQWLLETATADAQAARIAGRAKGVLIESDVPDSLSGFRRGLARVTPHLRFEGLGLEAGRATLHFVRQDGRAVRLEDVSDAEEQCILLAATFARIGLHRSVVLLDNPEHAIATEQQAAMMTAVCSLGTDNQVIAATSAPAILSSLPRDRVLQLVPGMAAPRAKAG